MFVFVFPDQNDEKKEIMLSFKNDLLVIIISAFKLLIFIYIWSTLERIWMTITDVMNILFTEDGHSITEISSQYKQYIKGVECI